MPCSGTAPGEDGQNLPASAGGASQWKNLKDYFLVVKDNRTYRACVVTAAANYRSAIEMASMGI
ncbi:hypothetical protein FNV65_50200 [Streptomyces sp. S1A1-8]|nr:hypothetical protein FNV58_51615 [Streptomyces sp. RLB1-9]QDO24977.1 hypothetical protein FNV65_50200 [Streptomyces sp. S1A1-8]QDO35098.1 hypothetical protein FNV63_50220 [Streptomyces sp. S1A1-3]